MIDDYVKKLIENLPDEIKNCKTPEPIDLILDGGIFNGSYLVGALSFLKEMEKRKYIKIERISGCSIGSVVAFLYYINALDLMPQLYDVVNNEFKHSYKLNTIKELKKYLIERIPEDICKKVNGKLFIAYNNIKRGKKIVRSVYKNVDDIINTIIKSSFVPYLIDGNILYKNKYIDGVNPFIFKERNKKILYLDLYGIRILN
jgi:predicted acylesterase/phospholipase RssA